MPGSQRAPLGAIRSQKCKPRRDLFPTHLPPYPTPLYLLQAAHNRKPASASRHHTVMRLRRYSVAIVQGFERLAETIKDFPRYAADWCNR